MTTPFDFGFCSVFGLGGVSIVSLIPHIMVVDTPHGAG
jgi:hypothetical protein